MKVYISGKITGEPDELVKKKFEQAEAQLMAFGHQPVSPLKNGLRLDESWLWGATLSCCLVVKLST